MQRQRTPSSGPPQENPNLGISADNTSLRRERTHRKFQFLSAVKFKLRSASGRKICKGLKVSHRLVADVADEIATGRYRSLVSYGYVYVSQKALGERLKVHERQVRRAIAALVELGLLRVERDHRARRTNLMIPLLDGGRLFEEIGCSDPERANPSSSQGAHVPSQERANVPSNFKGGEERKDSSPVDPSTASVTTAATPMTEEIKSDIGAVNGAERLPDGIKAPLPSINKHDPPSAIGPPNGSAIEINFARLMRIYPHPAGERQRKAYEPHALGRWHGLSAAEKVDAVRAAAKATGNVWVGHWLDRGRETGNFEIVERQPAVHRVWVREGTPQWSAWEDHRRPNGQRPMETQRMVGGELQTGWMFECEWPPAVEQPPNPEASDG
jgi:DNA-binding MarR family transcriptional regulator